MNRTAVRIMLASATLAGLAVPPLAGAATPSPTDTVAATTAGVLPDQTPATDGWLQPDFVDDPVNPVHQFGPVPGQTGITDRVTPTIMRVDNKLAAPLDHWYMWVWRHGGTTTDSHGYPLYDDAHSGRMVLLTAPRLEGPLTDHGFVTGANIDPPGYGPYSWTGGDVIWSPLHQKFYSFPHAHTTGCTYGGTGPCHLDMFEQESSDGVNWTTINGGAPVVPAGPATYDAFETGYAKVLRVDQPDGTEHWVMIYRSGRSCPGCNNTNEYYTLSLATANDAAGPWTKAANNPVYDPYAKSTTEPSGAGKLIGVDAIVYYHGYYNMLWQDGFLGDVFLTRTKDFRTWEDFAPEGANGVRPTSQHGSVPVFVDPRGPNDVAMVSADLVYDDQVGALTFVYLTWDAAQLAAPPGTVSINIARSVSGGEPLVGRND